MAKKWSEVDVTAPAVLAFVFLVVGGFAAHLPGAIVGFFLPLVTLVPYRIWKANRVKS